MNFAPLLCAIILGATAEGEVDFDTQIVPILTKAGCNAGACHGAAAGRGGFHLSLLGSDPAADYEAIVHQYEGRRINAAAPSKSLLLAKPTGFLDHGGEVVFDADSAEATRLREWIASGAARGKTRKLTRFELTPNQSVVELDSKPILLRAMAAFDDGPLEDVTCDVLFTPTDTSAVEIDAIGPKAILKRSGQQIVIARYLDRVLPIEFLVPYEHAVVAADYPSPQNFIDRQVFETLHVLRIPVSPAASDSEFLRRVTLDLTGRLPTFEAVNAFCNSVSVNKRADLVDALLASDAFTDYWTYRFARALQLHSLPNDKVGVDAYAAWLHEQIKQGRPLNEIASSLLTSTGDSHVVGPANFARMVGDARSQAELVGKVFMGVRLGCANCHNHPLDRWTQDDFHGFAAVFAKLDRGQTVKLTEHGAVTNLRTGEAAIPRIPGQRFLQGNGSHLQEVAASLTASDDRQFARAMVNRLWQAMMGRGLVEPIDDMRETNPPSHPQLLAELAEDFATNGYNLRHTLRRIALSEAYGRAHVATSENRADDRFYSHAYAKPMLPEVLADAVADVLETDLPSHSRKIRLIDPLEPEATLDLLGRCNRVGGCDEGETKSRGLAAQLHVLNGDFINTKLTAPGNRIDRLLAEKRSPVEIIGEFYRAGLSREPTADELSRWTAKLDSGEASQFRQRVEDFAWAMLSSRAFAENR